MDDSKVKIDEKELCELFAAGEPAKVHVAAAAAPAQAAPKTIELLDPNRAKSISIMLSRFRKPAAEIASDIKRLAETLKEDEVQALKSNLPTPDEIGTVNGYEGDPSLLGKAEQLVKALGTVQMLSQHLDYLMLRETFESTMAEIEEPIALLESGLKAIKDSKLLREALLLVLRIGNFVNGGSPRGGAYGFKLAFLSKICDIKTTRQGYTFANYLADKIDVYKLHEELASVKKSMSVDMETLKRSYNAIKGTVKRLEDAMPNAEKLAVQGYLLFPHFKKFMTDAMKKRVQAPEAKIAAVQKLYTDLVTAYGEDDSMPLADFVGMFQTFEDQLVKAKDANEQAKEAERRAASKPAGARGVPMPGMGVKMPGMGAGDAQRGVLDELMKTLSAGPARLRRVSRKGAPPVIEQPKNEALQAAFAKVKKNG